MMTVTTNTQEKLINVRRQRILYVTLFVVFSFFFVFRWLHMPSHQHLQQHVRRPRENNVEKTVSNSTSLPCDEECLRFGRLLDAWPADKPKAAVVVLLRNHGSFGLSSSLFGANFNNAYNYPVIVFHEDNMDNEADRKWLRSYSNSDLYLQVQFLSSCWVTTYILPARLCMEAEQVL